MSPAPLRRVLVANRGEIAVRIIRAAHELGVQAVAVYSEADQDSQWVHLADDAVAVGPSQATKSYLDVEAVVRAGIDSGCDAVHPGYGFLSERSGFARAVEDAGMVFVGPRPDTIDRMGDKASARAAAERAGVPVVPGSGVIDDPADAVPVAAEIGYPVLVKASAGGGGRGIRPVAEESELADAISRASREAEAAFGDGAVYLEKALVRARHVEVQVLADHHGAVVHCFERDCSVQRRRQKMLVGTRLRRWCRWRAEGAHARSRHREHRPRAPRTARCAPGCPCRSPAPCARSAEDRRRRARPAR